MCLKNPFLYYTSAFVSFYIGILWLVKGKDTWGFFFLTLAFAFLTIGIQFRSQEQISGQFDKNREQIILHHNEIFERLMDRFGDIRINFLWSLPHTKYSLFEYTAWRCRTLVDRGWKLVKSSKICKKNQSRFFNEMINFAYKSGIDWEGIKTKKIEATPGVENSKKLKEIIGNFLKMCDKFKDFDLDKPNKKELNGMIKLFTGIKNQLPEK